MDTQTINFSNYYKLVSKVALPVRTPTVTKQDLWGLPKDALPDILCFSSSLKYLDNSI